jgi:hypothetical protein
MNLLGVHPVSFEEPTIMLACHARFLFSATVALAVAALDPSPLSAAAANSATANAASPAHGVDRSHKGDFAGLTSCGL